MSTSSPSAVEPVRQSKGQRTRDDILSAAIRLASVHGLEALSIGMLATELGMSKAGLVAHFGNKQGLQVASVEAARKLVGEYILKPMLAAPEGLPQFQTFITRYFDYIERRVLPGGCFFTAISVEFDDQDGPVREQVCGFIKQRDELLVQVFTRAQALGQIRADVNPEDLAFEAVLLTQGAVVRHQLMRDAVTLPRAQKAIEALVARAATAA